MSRVSRAVLVAAFAAALASACTNVIVTPGASADGSTFTTYNADSTRRFGFLHYLPHATHPPNSTVDVYNYETGELIGTIDEVPETYNVVGLMNEYQVAIGETTFGGLAQLAHQTGALVDYGSLMYLALQRSRTAREAIAVMDSIAQRYGYYSTGESFSVSDAREAWIVEMIGKGEYERGAVWVARRVPDGYVCAHANQARITTFPRDDPDNCMYSADVVSFARAHGFYSGSDEDFSFSDVYAPMTFIAARACEARVWAAFRRVAGARLMDEYVDYALGHNLTHRMPLWVLPERKLALGDIMEVMRDHFQGSQLEMTADVGAEPFDAPYRWHPLQWTAGGRSYVHERPIATQQTGYGFVAQARAWLPREAGAVIWFAVDDTGCSVYFPMYACASRIPAAYSGDGGDIMSLDLKKAFWVFNMVANYAYVRWNLVSPVLLERARAHEERFFAETRDVDDKAAALLASGSRAEAVEFLTQYSVASGDNLAADWWEFYRLLFAKHMDGVSRVRDPKTGRPVITQPGYPAHWYSRIADETGDRYLAPGGPHAAGVRVPLDL